MVAPIVNGTLWENMSILNSLIVTDGVGVVMVLLSPTL